MTISVVRRKPAATVPDPHWEEYQAELERIRREGNRDAE
jgi:hypothetical protein